MSKAIIIDGCSLNYMRHPIGLQRYRFVNLFNFLTSLGTSAEVWRKPVYVSDGSIASKIKDSARLAGFDHVITYSKNEDDERIINYIDLLPDEVDEVVLVSADSDFVEVLDTRATKGNHITVVATMKPCQDGEAMVGWKLQRRFDSGSFQFVELADHRLRISTDRDVIDGPLTPIGPSRFRVEAPTTTTAPAPLSEVVEVAEIASESVAEVCPPPVEPTIVPKAKLRIKLEANESHEDTVSLLLAVMDVVRRHPGVRFKISN